MYVFLETKPHIITKDGKIVNYLLIDDMQKMKFYIIVRNNAA